MNKIKNIIAIMLFLSGITFLNGCIKGDFDQPPIITPRVDFAANMTLTEFNKYYTDSFPGGGFGVIKQDLIIKGVVISSDEAGNIYKALYLRDNSGSGIYMALNQSPLYTTYKLGQMIYVKCKGLYLGNYKGVTELGYNNAGVIGQIPNTLFSTHLFLDSFPQSPPVPKLTTIPAFTLSAISTLIKLDSVHFATTDTLQPFALPPYGTNRTVIDKNGNSVVIYSSYYATFHNNLVPSGTGSVTAILSYYSNTSSYQLYIRDLNDLKGFNP